MIRPRHPGAVLDRGRDVRGANNPTADDEAGSAVVEFLGAALLFLVPILYLVAVLSQVQAATYAADAAVRTAARAFTTAATIETAYERAYASAALALRDQGFADVDVTTALTIVCHAEPCLSPDAAVVAEITVPVRLPGTPAAVGGGGPLQVTVTSQQLAVVDRFGERP